MTGLLLLCACQFAWAAVAPSHNGLSDPQSMHRFIEQQLHQTGAPGATWVAVEQGAPSYSGAAGLAAPGSDRPFTPQTPIQIGSISKPFTAVAVMQLVESGAIELDAPVVRYLPDFELADSSAVQQITVRQLLSHTSGISTLAGNLTQADLDMSRRALQARMRPLADVRPASPPGVRWQYSNANYQVLGTLIEEISGLEYGRYIDRKILQPLGMTNSYVVDPPEDARPAVGHRSWFGQLRPVSTRLQGRGSGPQGGLIVSAEDLGKFLAMMLNREDDILTSGTKAEMMSAQPGAQNYGLGWYIRDAQGSRLIWHSGESPGFEAVAAMDPNRQSAFAIATNAHSGFAVDNMVPLTFGTTDVAFGMEPIQAGQRPIRLAIYGVLFLVPLIAAVYIGYLVVKRRRRALKRPSGLAATLVRIVVPALLFVGASYGLLVLLPNMFDAPLSAAWLYFPDMALLLVVAAVALLLLALVRTWALLTANKPTAISGGSG